MVLAADVELLQTFVRLKLINFAVHPDLQTKVEQVPVGKRLAALIACASMDEHASTKNGPCMVSSSLWHIYDSLFSQGHPYKLILSRLQ